jgi:hypothetical protein
VAFFFVLTLLLDSACTTACIPAELEAPAEHCASGPDGAEPSERGCDLHAHLKPMVKDRGDVAAPAMREAAATLGALTTARSLESFHSSTASDFVLCLLPFPQPSSVLRI